MVAPAKAPRWPSQSMKAEARQSQRSRGAEAKAEARHKQAWIYAGERHDRESRESLGFCTGAQRGKPKPTRSLYLYGVGGVPSYPIGNTELSLL